MMATESAPPTAISNAEAVASATGTPVAASESADVPMVDASSDKKDIGETNAESDSHNANDGDGDNDDRATKQSGQENGNDLSNDKADGTEDNHASSAAPLINSNTNQNNNEDNSKFSSNNNNNNSTSNSICKDDDQDRTASSTTKQPSSTKDVVMTDKKTSKKAVLPLVSEAPARRAAWTCNTCTFMNAFSDNTCSMCGALSAVAQPSNPGSSGQASKRLRAESEVVLLEDSEGEAQEGAAKAVAPAAAASAEPSSSSTTKTTTTATEENAAEATEPPAAKRVRKAASREELPRKGKSCFKLVPTDTASLPPLPTPVRSQSSTAKTTTTEMEPPLSEKQEQLLRKVLIERQNVFFTGPAGTGKSRTLRELVRRAPEGSTFVTALTGMASTHLPRGTTLHSFSGMGLAKGTKEECFKRAYANRKAVRNWAACDILIIDEASMMSKALFEKLEFVARKMKKKQDLPFGGVVLCLCGDFYQLPPVSRGVAGDEALFCFESEMWQKALQDRNSQTQNCFELTEVFRQKDATLLDVLSEVRHNKVTPHGVDILSKMSRALKVQAGIEPTRLFPTNAKADAVNNERLAALPGGQGQEVVYEAWDKVPEGAIITREAMDQMTSLPRRVHLKVGAQVMLLKNKTPTLVNGSRGVIEKFEPGSDGISVPTVRFLSGETMSIGREEEAKDLSGNKKATRYQIPLRLSWAITIHKAQGMSIDYLEVDLRNVFEAGQAYVALSRARTMEGLRVMSFDPTRFWTNPKVEAFYSSNVKPI